jgi:hypothetical protein
MLTFLAVGNHHHRFNVSISNQTLAIEKEYAPLEHIPGAYSVGK